MSRQARGRFVVVMTYPDGERVELARTRRFNGAVSELDLHVASKRAQLSKHADPGDRIVEGPDELGPQELAVTVIVSVAMEASYRYGIEEAP